jgi:XisI protein
VDTLKDTLKKVVAGYAGKAINARSYLTVSPDEQVFTVVAVGTFQGERFATTGLIVRLLGDTIIVERDVNDKPLVDALVQEGVPRDKIILAYAGEAVPETA